MFRTKCGSSADKILRLLGVGHDVTLEAQDWIDAAALFVIQQKIAMDREYDITGQIATSCTEGPVELLLRAKARQGQEEATHWIAEIFSPTTTNEEAETQIREFCAAGYITEQDVDEIMLR